MTSVRGAGLVGSPQGDRQLHFAVFASGELN